MEFNTLIKLSGLGRAKKYCVLCFALISTFSITNATAQNCAPLALIGGQGNAPYAAFLEADGSVFKLPGLPNSGLIYRVAINPSGNGIIGGTNSLNAYAALVSPAGVLNPISGLMAPGEIYTVAINTSGNGIIGGGHFDSNVPYAALVSCQGTLTSLSVPSSGLIYSVAIDNSGEGIVGGIGASNAAYTALVSPTGNVSPLIGLPSTGAIYWVSSNDSKTRFIGGQDNANIYAAFISPNGNILPVSGLPVGTNYSVAINASGQAIMGGTASSQLFAALVSPDGTLDILRGLPGSEGKIYTAAINDSGTGLLAGFTATGAYGTLVHPNGALIPLIGLPTGNSFLDGAAIHSAGVGLVGGTKDNTPFLALVAPNGTLTYIKGLPGNGEINSISIAMLDGTVPRSIGPFDSWANTQYALNDALTQHSIFHRNNNRGCSCAERLPSFNFGEGCSSIWLSVLGNNVREKCHRSLPAFSNNITGVLLGYDYLANENVVLGGVLAYAHNSVHYSRKGGKASINQEYIAVYATFNGDSFYFNAALWGGIFQSTNKRRTFNLITSEAKPAGWNLSPHLEIGRPYLLSDCMNTVLEPFASLDWSHNWQNHFCEKGPSGFNITLNDQHASILRTELGLRLYETFTFDWGNIFLEEKLSYVNRTPTQRGKGNASFICSISSFDVDTLNSAALNQGIFQLHMECTPALLKGLYASFDYQVGFGSLIESQMLTFSIGKSF